ncbi:urate hydroxylase PuuD [Chelatococcus sp. SYSU_G07232]|uniref:Urate hydroxylase PuuD n=1 Tax=Chelatococcus albus TaxID=3047466 RepID=A0ABT7ACG3_9HYPH|nr:urate hydroxylase PuuD [Chelatococcus sp. SYSU_G07232]MDJ1157063.1 urate hydroxylase PuuD [Chelatococcus sp. SYSU_G07232]
MESIVWEWINLLLRWLHVITAIAWIGSSFYFVHLDASLRRREGLPQGAGGEAWQIHGGGFYHMVKYLVAPARMPEDLTWFKWESYATWISGFFLLCVLYYRGADLFMVDPAVMPLPRWGAVAISAGGLAAGWLAYDLLCRSPLGRNDNLLAAAGFVGLVAAAYGFTQVFSGRGAMLQMGALIGTMMTANVFLVIIPNQRKVVDALIAGREPDPMLGKKAKQRSMHNNYLTLPVLFLMISNHYPLAFGTRFNWLIVAVVLVIGASVRHFFNSRHAGKPTPWWTWGVAAAGVAAIVWLSTLPPAASEKVASAETAAPAEPVTFARVEEIVVSRCSMCHAQTPVWEGLPTAPRGVRLDTPEEIRRHAGLIRVQSVLSHAMPPGNITEITAEERRALAAWTADPAAVQ